MEENTIKDNKHTLPTQLSVLVDETLGKALTVELKGLQSLIFKINEALTTYSKNSLTNIDQKSISGVLFESFNVTILLKKILGDYVRDSNAKVFDQELINLNSQALICLNIEDEVKFLANKATQSLLDKIQENLKKTLNSIQKKNKGNPKIFEYYQYFHLIYQVLQSHVERMADMEIRRLNILSNLWKKSTIINENISILSEGNYDIAAANKLTLIINFEDTEKLLADLIEEGNAFIQSINAAIKDAFENLEKEKFIHKENMEKDKRKYTPAHVFRASKAIENDFNNSQEKWHNTLLALSDDWTLELEIYALKFHILKGYFDFIYHVDNKLKNPLDEEINYLRDFTGELMKMFKPTDTLSPDETIRLLKKRKSDFHEKLISKILPDIKNILINGNLPHVVDNFEKNTLKQFDVLSKSKYLIKDPVYDHPVEQSEMYKISPHDLVSFDMQPKFMKGFPSLKNAIIRHLGVLQVKFEEIPEVVEFSIESALGYYEDKKDLNESLKIGFEGIKRAVNKIDDLSEIRVEFYNTEVDLLKDKISGLIEEISEITDNESALQIKIRVTKAKAIEQSKAVRDKVIKNVKNFLPIIINKVRTLYHFLIESSIKIRKQFEGETTKGFITSDVSDYLVETEEAVSRLPFVYQRLFKLEPLSTFDLYIERNEAHKKFELAYSRWKNGKFAPVVITGEKGSGKTSFINRALASKSINEKIIFHDLHREYQDPKVAYNKIFESINELLAIENNKVPDSSKIIVVIDGLEKLFETKIDGFNILQKTVHLISKTNSQVFWVVACHLYSYKYLEKSFNIPEYFGYHIELEDLSAEDLVKIIEKRHNISGFRLKFLPDIQKKSIMPSIKQVAKNDQMELREIYFDRLQKIVSGNITQAFLYWMRSAAEVTEDVIYITQTDTKLDFIKSISLSKFEILKNILMHNGISSNKHSEIFRIPFEKSELQLEQMLDDGIIIKRSEFYNINPMIYKQVIEQMYKLNLLH